ADSDEAQHDRFAGGGRPWIGFRHVLILLIDRRRPPAPTRERRRTEGRCRQHLSPCPRFHPVSSPYAKSPRCRPPRGALLNDCSTWLITEEEGNLKDQAARVWPRGRSVHGPSRISRQGRIDLDRPGVDAPTQVEDRPRLPIG